MWRIIGILIVGHIFGSMSYNAPQGGVGYRVRIQHFASQRPPLEILKGGRGMEEYTK